MSDKKSNIKYHQFDNICRFCLKNDFILKPIFHECSLEVKLDDCLGEVNDWDEYLNISEYVRRLTDLQIEQNDPYPKFLCLDCLNIIKTVKSFRSKCISSFEVLQEVKTNYRIRKDSGAAELDPDDYGLDMQISEQKFMEGFPEDEFNQTELDLYADPEIRFDGLHQKTDDDKVAEVMTNPAKEIDQITTELDNTHITTDQDLEAICPDLWRAATVWSKFIIDMDSIVYENHTEYTIFVDGGLTNSQKEFSCKILLLHADWKKSTCESCNPAAEPSMCEHILALVINLGLVAVPAKLIPKGWN